MTKRGARISKSEHERERSSYTLANLTSVPRSVRSSEPPSLAEEASQLGRDEHEAQLMTQFFSWPPPPAAPFIPPRFERAPLSRESRRAMWASIVMLVVSGAGIAGFAAYQHFVMPQPAELGQWTSSDSLAAPSQLPEGASEKTPGLTDRALRNAYSASLAEPGAVGEGQPAAIGEDEAGADEPSGAGSQEAGSAAPLHEQDRAEAGQPEAAAIVQTPAQDAEPTTRALPAAPTLAAPAAGSSGASLNPVSAEPQRASQPSEPAPPAAPAIPRAMPPAAPAAAESTTLLAPASVPSVPSVQPTPGAPDAAPQGTSAPSVQPTPGAPDAAPQGTSVPSVQPAKPGVPDGVPQGTSVPSVQPATPGAPDPVPQGTPVPSTQRATPGSR